MAKKEQHPAQKYLNVAGVIIGAIDADQKVNLINKKSCEILGYKEDEIVEKNWFEHREPFRDTFAKMRSGEIEAVEYFENPVVTKNGEERIVAWHNSVLTDQDGRIIGTLSSREGIIERKQNEELLPEIWRAQAVVLRKRPGGWLWKRP